MDNVHRPTKEQVRQWLAERRLSHAPLPDAALIRHQLGWAEGSRTGDQSIQPASPSDDLLAA
ncbi:MAG TPA: hypothetical protein DHV59_02315 [Oxalobacteraceae bacterium]|nr:hypothetical protein [Oxalobacteraceae bacterium]